MQRCRDEKTSARQVLRFTPIAWAKLHFFCHFGETEIGGFGTARPDDLLMVEEFVTVKQNTTGVSVKFEDAAVADFFDAQVDASRKPEQFARIWVHSHPGDSPIPSPIDEDTFERAFGGCDWAVMFILARSGRTYARLRFNVGPTGQLLIPAQVDYSQPFAGSDHDAWEQEYKRNVHVETIAPCGGDTTRNRRARPVELGLEGPVPSALTEHGAGRFDIGPRFDPDDFWLEQQEMWP